jgi:hypothetical protein
LQRYVFFAENNKVILRKKCEEKLFYSTQKEEEKTLKKKFELTARADLQSVRPLLRGCSKSSISRHYPYLPPYGGEIPHPGRNLIQ